MFVNVSELTERLVGNRDAVASVLCAIGYRESELKYNHHEEYFRFRRPDGDNPSGMILYLKTLRYICFTRADKGSLYSLVMAVMNLSFPEALRFISSATGIETSDYQTQKIHYPFGGFYREMLPENQYPEMDLKIYPEETLTPFQNKFSKMWNDEGISYKTQETFGIGMSLRENAILIPERNTSGNLIGIQARRNEKDCPHESRWWAYVPCSRNQTLFGYSINYKRIVEKGTLFIVESEKSVMKAYEMGIRNVVAICGCRISESQVKLLKALYLKRYILALDEGLPEIQVKLEASKLKLHNPIMKTNVDYIYDGNEQFLKQGSKNSPFDLPLNDLKGMLKNCLKKEI